MSLDDRASDRPSGPHPTPRSCKLPRRPAAGTRLFAPALVRMATRAVVRHARPGGHGPEPGDVRGRGRHRPDVDRHRSSRSSTGAAIGLLGYLAALTVWLLLTVLFANFAAALAEARGKAQADSLRADPRRHAGLPPRRPRVDRAARSSRRPSCGPATSSSSRPARSSPATARSSRASPRSTSRPSPASRPRSSARPAATAPASPAARASCPTASSSGSRPSRASRSSTG